ncbi:CAP domain-containing protein [Peribacillus cavernae]|uniref:CAP domain-containing protein n=1 Tax=Peribacillus cavernae TaxID=1674310 RepID=UPI001FE5157E|nr:CAP domain-containing protein [Peribacillus cavernae]MDQ0219237.1 uncharacterized protein YkwD [Peribacillus cavernae]
MRRFLFLLSILVILFASWSYIGKPADKASFQTAFNHLDSQMTTIKENPDVSAAVDKLSSGLDQLLGQLDKTLDPPRQEQQQSDLEQIEKPSLATPTEDVFTVYNIGLGDSKDMVEKQVGAAKRSSYNEYGVEWHAYHKDYQNFMMAAYDENNKVAGLYSNQDLIASTKGIKRGSSKESVLGKLGEPLSKIRKGMVYYQFEKDRDYEMYLIDGSYVTVFFDKHQKNTVTSIQIISEKLEQNRKGFYTQESEQLKQGFEYQLFDVTNAARVNHQLPVLSWDNHVKETARKHSDDMADNNYFNHTNQEGQSPFDRMQEDEVVFNVAGENLASGQFSSIFAHEGLMNSLGHRENILKKDYEYLGVGVAFDDKSKPYYTENFYTN